LTPAGRRRRILAAATAPSDLTAESGRTTMANEATRELGADVHARPTLDGGR
jgi:hypothetical protein